MFFLNIFVIEGIVFGTLSEIFLQVSQNCILCPVRSISGNGSSLKKINFFPFFRTLSAKHIRRSAKMFRQFCQNCIQRIHCSNSGLNNSLGKNLTFRTIIETFKSFWIENSVGLSRLHSTCPYETFKNYIILSKFF